MRRNYRCLSVFATLQKFTVVQFQVAIYKTQAFTTLTKFPGAHKIITAEYLKVAANIYKSPNKFRCLLKLQVATSGTLRSRITEAVSIY